MCTYAKIAVFLVLTSSFLLSQVRHDPLTDNEITQLRDSALDPYTRLKLYTEFARARLIALEQVRTNPKITDRAQKTHDHLQEFLDVYDELDDNINNFDKRGDDLRKVLKLIIQADNEFRMQLHALHDSGAGNAEEFQQYEIVLADATDAVNSAAKDHRDLLAEQEEAAKHKKKSSQAAEPRE